MTVTAGITLRSTFVNKLCEFKAVALILLLIFRLKKEFIKFLLNNRIAIFYLTDMSKSV